MMHTESSDFGHATESYHRGILLSCKETAVTTWLSNSLSSQLNVIAMQMTPPFFFLLNSLKTHIKTFLLKNGLFYFYFYIFTLHPTRCPLPGQPLIQSSHLPFPFSFEGVESPLGILPLWHISLWETRYFLSS